MTILNYFSKVSRIEADAVPGQPAVMRATPFPESGIEVSAEVISVSRALVDSPSMAEESSVAIFSIVEGRLPGLPDIQKIKLRFASAVLGNPFHEGQRVTFRFLKDGEFFDIKELQVGF